MEALQVRPQTAQEIPWALTFNPLRFRQLVVDPYAFMKDSREQCGPLYRIRGPGGEQVVVAHPEAARIIFALPPEQTQSFGNEIFAPLIGEQTVLGMSGDRHKQERKMLMPHFHGQRMRAYAEVIESVTRRELEQVALNQPFAMQDVTQRVSLQVIIRAVFGIQQDAQVREAIDAVISMVKDMTPSVVFLPSLRRNFMGFGPWARFSRSKNALGGLLEREIDRRRATGELGEDILSLMVGSHYEDGAPLTREHIRDELMTLLFAGHETTAVALAWAMYWLHKCPETQTRLREELATLPPDASADAVARLPYLDAVSNETLRLYPIVPVVMRKLNVPLQLMGYDVPVGSKVAVCTGWMHHDPEIYADPLAFKPERFLERTFGPQEFFPFGAGNRRCLGAAFAQYELKVVLARLLQGGTYRLEGNAPIRFERRNAVVGPKAGVRMVRLS
jgi:cytochrome P450